jgi:hypothetical protein
LDRRPFFVADAGAVEAPTAIIRYQLDRIAGARIKTRPTSPAVHQRFGCDGGPVKVDPSTFCAGNRAPNIYYRLSGRTRYEGIFLPIEIGPLALGKPTLSSAAQVQVR